MGKELEALTNIKREAGMPHFSALYDIDMWREDFAIVEKALKALEIIKKKQVDIGLFVNCNDVREYNNLVYFELYNYMLTEEEFNLLKEVLLGEKVG